MFVPRAVSGRWVMAPVATCCCPQLPRLPRPPVVSAGGLSPQPLDSQGCFPHANPSACLDEEGGESAELPDARLAWCLLGAPHGALPALHGPTPAVTGKMRSEPALGFWK